MIPILTGLVASGLHVVSVDRHLNALSPIGAEMPTRGGSTGGFWGMIHGVVVVVLGGLALALRSFFEVDAWQLWGGFTLGFLFVLLGFRLVYRASRFETHDHPHVHPRTSHEHIHTHGLDSQTHDHDVPSFGILDRALGPTNTLAVVPAVIMPTAEAVIYLVTYLVMVVVAMSVFGYWLGHSRRRGDDPDWVNRGMSIAGFTGVALGVVWTVDSWPF